MIENLIEVLAKMYERSQDPISEEFNQFLEKSIGG